MNQRQSMFNLLTLIFSNSTCREVVFSVKRSNITKTEKSAHTCEEFFHEERVNQCPSDWG